MKKNKPADKNHLLYNRKIYIKLKILLLYHEIYKKQCKQSTKIPN